MTCPCTWPVTPQTTLHCWLVNVDGCIASSPLIGLFPSTISRTEKEAITKGLMYSAFMGIRFRVSGV